MPKANREEKVSLSIRLHFVFRARLMFEAGNTDLGYTSIEKISSPTAWSSLIRTNFPESVSADGYSLVE
jgi:hypothetical protein